MRTTTGVICVSVELLVAVSAPRTAVVLRAASEALVIDTASGIVPEMVMVPELWAKAAPAASAVSKIIRAVFIDLSF